MMQHLKKKNLCCVFGTAVRPFELPAAPPGALVLQTPTKNFWTALANYYFLTYGCRNVSVGFLI